MYLITCHGGSYDDCWTSSLYVTDNLKKGEQFVNEKNSLILKCQKAQRKLYKVSIIYDIHNIEPNDLDNDWDKEETLELHEKWTKNKKVILKEWLTKHFTIEIVNELINDKPFYEQILDQYYSIDIIKVL